MCAASLVAFLIGAPDGGIRRTYRPTTAGRRAFSYINLGIRLQRRSFEPIRRFPHETVQACHPPRPVSLIEQ